MEAAADQAPSSVHASIRAAPGAHTTADTAGHSAGGGPIRSALETRTPVATQPPMPRRWLALWAASGPLTLLLAALWRLAPRAADALLNVSSVPDGVLLGVSAASMIWLEGHRGFHVRVVPDVTARVENLATSATGWRAAFAPLISCELIGAPRQRLVRRWMLVAGIIGAILATRALPEPARGIVSAAVFCGLAWGTGSLLLALLGMRHAKPALGRT